MDDGKSRTFLHQSCFAMVLTMSRVVVVVVLVVASVSNRTESADLC